MSKPEHSSAQARDAVPPSDDAARAAATVNEQQLLEKYDSEYRYRTFDRGVIRWVIRWLAIAFSLYHLYTAFFGTPPTLIHRSLHVAGILALIFLLYPATNKQSRRRLPWYDVILALLAMATSMYMIAEFERLIFRQGMPSTLDLFFGTLLVVLVIEAARRLTGWALPILALLFAAYALFGRQLPGIFMHRGYSWEQLVDYLYVTTEGIYGTAISVSASYIFLFILFGAFLSKSGMGKLFNDLAMALAGHTKGGPAKVAVIASGFLGSINGSAVANVVTTGSFTIPLMKRVGYRKEFAGAVEASASVGGQILPPVMGAAAFIMAEILGMKYATIALAALLPALLYYLGILTQVHLRAAKEGLEGIRREELPKLKDVLKERGHLLLPLIFLIYMIFFSGKTIIFSALWTIVVTVVVSMLHPSTRMSLKDILDALEEGARTTLGVAIACATVGIIVGVATLTGLGLKLASAIVTLGGGQLFLTLVFTMLACILLGMGLPSIPTYIITVTMAAPALVELGVPPLVAHLFVFYFGLFANLTPPVALAAYAAAGISRGDPMRTGFASMKLAAAGFIVPFIFVYDNSLLLLNTPWQDAVRIIITSVFGVVMLGAAIEGQLRIRLPLPVRVLLLAGALLFLTPNFLQDLIGLAILVGILTWQWFQAKRQLPDNVRQAG